MGTNEEESRSLCQAKAWLGFNFQRLSVARSPIPVDSSLTCPKAHILDFLSGVEKGVAFWSPVSPSPPPNPRVHLGNADIYTLLSLVLAIICVMDARYDKEKGKTPRTTQMPPTVA